jgi:hypothetical protein
VPQSPIRTADAAVLERSSGRASGAGLIGLLADPRFVAIVAGIVAFVVLWLSVAPLAGATNDTDSAASVLYFARLVEGRHLDAFFPTTPKPLLTIVFGAAWSATHDWRSIAILTIFVAAIGAGLAARLAARFGGTAAAVLAVIAMLAWPDFRAQVAGGNSFVWGAFLWVAAGELISGSRPRYVAAGVALLLAGLVRTETIYLVAAAGLLAVAMAVRARRAGERIPFAPFAPAVIGAMFVPLACLHDRLLTGSPLFWLGVPAGYTAIVFPGMGSGSVLTMLHQELVHYLPVLPIVAAAVAAVAWLFVSGRRALAVALTLLPAGVLFALVLLTWRAVYVSPRYYEEADAPMLLAAAIGTGALLKWLVGWVAGRFEVGGDGGGRTASLVVSDGPDPDRGRGPVVNLAATVLALVLAVPVAVFVPAGSVDAQLSAASSGSAALAQVEPKLAPILAGATGSTVTVAGVSYPVADAASARIFVPRPFVPRIAVDMGVPTTALGDSYLAFRDGTFASLAAGQWVLHIAGPDADVIYAPFEIDAPVTVTGRDGASLRLVPEYVDKAAGIWLIRVEAVPAS